MLCHYIGRSTALSCGREGNVHFGDRRRSVIGMVSLLPDMMLVANGLGPLIPDARPLAVRAELRR